MLFSNNAEKNTVQKYIWTEPYDASWYYKELKYRRSSDGRFDINKLLNAANQYGEAYVSE